MRGKRIAACLLLAVVPTAALLVAAEFIFRRYQPVVDQRAWGTHPRGEWASCYRPSVTLGYEPVPGRCGFNSLGLAADHARDKDRQTLRVLLLGDSLSERQGWVGDMRRRLSAGVPGRRVEVWNGGVTGYDTCAELRVLQEKGWRANPDLVLVQLCINDFFATSSILPLPGGRVRFHAGARSVEMPAWVLSSQLLTWLIIRLGLAEEGPGRGPGAASVERCLARMKQEADTRRVPLAVLVFPVLSSTGGAPRGTVATYLGLEREAGHICSRLKLSCFRLRPGLERAGSVARLRQRPDDPWHINVQGQQLVGRLVTKFVQRKLAGKGGEVP